MVPQGKGLSEGASGHNVRDAGGLVVSVESAGLHPPQTVPLGSLRVPAFPSDVYLADFRAVVQRNTRITYSSTGLRLVNESDVSGCCARVYNKAGKGFAFLDSLRHEDAEEAVRLALRLAETGRFPHEVGKNGISTVQSRALSVQGTDPGLVPLEQKVAMLKKLVENVRKMSRARPFVEVHYIDQTVEERVCNSTGTDVWWRAYRSYALLRVFLQSGGRLRGGSEYYATNQGIEGLSSMASDGFGRTAVEIAEEQVEAAAVKPGKYRVILDPQLSGVLIHETLGHQLEADNLIRSESILKERIGQKVAPEILTVYDDPALEQSFASYPFDSEGTRTGNTVLMDGGRVKGCLNSMETASVVGGHGGNARAQNHQVEPIPRISNICVAQGDYSTDELMEEVRDGLFLKGIGPASDTNTATGQVRLRVQSCVRIQSGEFASPSGACTLYADTLAALRSIGAIGRDRSRSMPGFCVKDGQTVPTDGLSPSVLILEIGIAT